MALFALRSASGARMRSSSRPTRSSNRPVCVHLIHEHLLLNSQALPGSSAYLRIKLRSAILFSEKGEDAQWVYLFRCLVQKGEHLMSYVHLTQAKRYQIEFLNKAGITPARMAEQLGVHPSTISRELKRGECRHGRYEGEYARWLRCAGGGGAEPTRDGCRPRFGNGRHGSSAGIGRQSKSGAGRDALACLGHRYRRSTPGFADCVARAASCTRTCPISDAIHVTIEAVPAHGWLTDA